MVLLACSGFGEHDTCMVPAAPPAPSCKRSSAVRPVPALAGQILSRAGPDWKFFCRIGWVGISRPVHRRKDAAPWWSSIYIPLKVFSPASRAILSSCVSRGW